MWGSLRIGILLEAVNIDLFNSSWTVILASPSIISDSN